MITPATTTAAHFTAEPVNSSTSASSAFVAFLLAQLHCAKLHAQITINQIETATVALSAGMISPEVAILILAEAGVEVEVWS